MDKIAALLEDNGPLLSGKLAKIYESKYSVTNTAARKAISRARKPVIRLYGLFFDKGQYFYYLESQYMKDKYCDRLYSALSENRTYKTYLRAFQNQGGGISKKWLAAYTASPVKNVKGHKLYEDIVAVLRNMNVIEELDDHYWKLNDRFSVFNYGRMRAIENSKKMIVNDFNQWAGRINLGAFGSGRTIDEKAEVANFQWACTIPSYTQPFYDDKQQQPGFIVVDIVIGKQADLDDIDFFLQKLSIVRNFKKVGYILPVLLVDTVNEEAFKELKKQKIVIGIIKNLFDKRYADLLNELVNLYTNATAILLKDPDQIYHLFEKIGQMEGRFNNTRGSLFEFMVGYYYQKIGCNYLEMNKLIYSERGNYKELDVLADRDGIIIVAECKAMNAELGSDFVEKWLNENIPFTRNSLNKIYSGKKHEFQLWSVSGFDKEAIRILENARQATKKYNIRYFDKEEMIKMASEHQVTQFTKMLKEHFT